MRSPATAPPSALLLCLHQLYLRGMYAINAHHTYNLLPHVRDIPTLKPVTPNNQHFCPRGDEAHAPPDTPSHTLGCRDACIALR